MNLNIKTLSLAILLTILLGCTEESKYNSDSSTDEEVISPATLQSSTCQNGSAKQQGQIKDSTTSRGLKDVIVTIDGCYTKTDKDGFYTLNNIAEKDNVLITIEKNGYLTGTSKTKIKTLSSNYLEYELYAYDDEKIYNSDTSVPFEDVGINDNAYTDTSGNIYKGKVKMSISSFSSQRDIFFKSTFEGKNYNGVKTKLYLYSIKSIAIKGEKSKNLNIADNETIDLAFDGHTELKDQTVSLWYYDTDNGLWIEKGNAERQSGGWYKGEVPYTGTWSLAKPIEGDLGIYSGCIVYEDGSAAQDIRIELLGDTWKSIDTSTDSDGCFEIKVAPSKDFRLKVYNYRDKYGVEFPTKILGVAAGQISENIQ